MKIDHAGLRIAAEGYAKQDAWMPMDPQAMLALLDERGRLREALQEMLDSYDLLGREAVEHFGNPTLLGVIRGAFLSSPQRARKALAVSCVSCGRPVEAERECYAHPTCYTCLPPPPPLEEPNADGS